MANSSSTGTLPTLKKGDNFTIWHVALHSQGLENDWHNYLTEEIQTPPDADHAALSLHNKRKAQALRTLLTYTSQELLSELEIEVTIDTHPATLFHAIKSRFQARTDPATQQNLMKEVLSITFDKFSTIDEYISSHRSIRQRMINAKVPGISDETLTVHYIISGIESTHLPDYIGRNLRFQQFKTVEECHQGIATLCRPIKKKPITAAAMNSQGQTPKRGSGSSRRGRRNFDRGQGNRQRFCHYHKEYDSCWRNPTPGAAKNETKIAPRPHRQRRANAVIPGESEFPENVPTDNNSAINTDDSEYILDSGAWPTHLRRPQSQMRKYRKSKYTVTADNSPAKLSHYGTAKIPSFPKSMTISKAIVAPSFQTNLVSVNQVCKSNRSIIFNDDAAYIVPKVPAPPKDSIIAIAQAKNGLYKLKTIPSEQKNQAKTARIHGFREWKRSQSNNRTKTIARVQPQKAQQNQPNLAQRSTKKPTTLMLPPNSSDIAGTIDCTINDRLPNSNNSNRKAPTSAEDWHLIMNHTNYTKLSKMANRNLVDGMPATLNRPSTAVSCSGCAVGHQSNAPFKGKMPRYTICDLVTADIGEPSQQSVQGFLYFATYTETYTRRKLIFLCKKKSDVREHTKTALNRIATQLGAPIKRFKPDGAKEFLASDIREYCNSKGILVDPSTRYTPQENSISEQFNRTLMERSRSSLFTAKMPFQYWDFAILDTVTKYNNTYHDGIRAVPEALWNPSRKPKISTFQPFGAFGYTTFIDSVPRKLKKNQPRAVLTRYLYRPDPLHYFVLDTRSHKIFKCRSANFTAYTPNLDPTRLLTRPPILANKANAKGKRNQLKIPNIPAAIININRPKPRPPSSLREARSYLDAHLWELAYNEQIASHEALGTFKWVLRRTIPENAAIYPPAISFRYKCDTEGNIKGRKVRISYRGDKTKPYEHYDPQNLATYAPDKDAIRLVVAIGTHLDMDMHHVDISSAYLHEDIDSPTPLYMRKPPPFYGGRATRTIVGQLIKNIYGLRQASPTYSDGLRKHLQSLGYKTNGIETQVYILQRGNEVILMPTVTDDFLIAPSSSSLLEECKQHLRAKYTIRDLGAAENFIGWRITRNRKHRTTTISQPALSMQILEDFHMTECHPASTPYLSGVTLEPIHTDETPLDTNQFPYASCVGALRYLADSTRPDLAQIVRSLARSLNRPARRHWNAAKRVLRYLKGTIHLGITYKHGTGELSAESDADYANCKSTRKSVHAHIVFFNGAPISWASRTIKTVCTSTCEAEYIAAGQAAKQVRYIHTLLRSFFSPQTKPPELQSKLFKDAIPLGIDNTAAIRIATATAPTKRSKYIDVQHHFIQELVRNWTIRPFHHPSKTLTADLLTKQLPETRFTQLRNQLCMSVGPS